MIISLQETSAGAPDNTTNLAPYLYSHHFDKGTEVIWKT